MGEKAQPVEIRVERIKGGYMIHLGDAGEPLIGELGSDGFLVECKRVGEALGLRGADILTAVKACLSDEVQAILQDPRPLDRVGEALDDIIAGEDNNKRLLFVLLLSALTMDPGLNEMILFKSSAGGGKSHTANSLTRYYKTKKIGRFSRTALDYTDLKNHQVLYLQELGQMDSEEYGVSTVKFLSSEDGGYTIEITVRDPDTGGMTTMQRHIPPLTVVSSTARVNIDGQFERRCWILSVDETPEQTEKIRQLNAKHELERVEMHLGLRLETSGDRAERLLRSLIEAVKPRKVCILFPDTLMSVLRSQRLRIRGDYKKIIRLLKYYCWLKQYTITGIDVEGERVLFPTPMDAMEILEVAVQPLIFMTQDVEGRDLKLLEGMEALNITRKGTQISPSLREELRLRLGYSKSTILQYLNHLVDRGFLTDDEQRPKNYTLVDSLPKIKREISSVSDIIENREAFILQMLQEATRNLERLAAKKPELEELRDHFTYDPGPMGGGGDFYGTSQKEPENTPKNENGGESIPHNPIGKIWDKREPLIKKEAENNPTNANPIKTPPSTYPDTPSSIQAQLDSILGYLNDLLVDPSTEEVAEYLQVCPGEAVKLLRILDRDRRVFQPRSGYWRLT